MALWVVGFDAVSSRELASLLLPLSHSAKRAQFPCVGRHSMTKTFPLDIAQTLRGPA